MSTVDQKGEMMSSTGNANDDPYLTVLAALSARASKDWAVPRNAAGSVVGGDVQHFSNGSTQTQIASFCVPRLPDTDPRDPADVQAANAQFAVACVGWVRLLIHGLAGAAIVDLTELIEVVDELADWVDGVLPELDGEEGGNSKLAAVRAALAQCREHLAYVEGG